MKHTDDYLWDPAGTPDPAIQSIENALRQYRYQPGESTPELQAEPRQRRWGRLVALAAALTLAMGLGAAWLAMRPQPWRLAVEGGASVRQVGEGEVVITEGGTATLSVGSIGEVVVSPGSELAIVDTGSTSHRLALRRGSLRARIWAPPRFFIVDTPGGSAVDLGCIYLLHVDDAGVGTLEVQHGGVELVSGGRRITVLAGMGATIGPDGVGVPWSLVSPPEFRRAADHVAFGQGTAADIDMLVAAVDSREAVTLYHLLPLVDDATRQRLIERTLDLTGTAGFRRDAVMALDSLALANWHDAIESKLTTRKRWWQEALIRLNLAKPQWAIPAKVVRGKY